MKTSITLEESTIRAIDKIAGNDSNRSRVIERAVTEFVQRRRRAAREAQDLDAINEAADELNEEMEDVLGYQIDP